MATKQSQPSQRYGVKKKPCTIVSFTANSAGRIFPRSIFTIIDRARKQNLVAVCESCRVTDLQITNAGVMLATNQGLPSETFDLAVIATGHVWPDEEEATRTYFQPVVSLMEAGSMRVTWYGNILERTGCGNGSGYSAWFVH